MLHRASSRLALIGAFLVVSLLGLLAASTVFASPDPKNEHQHEKASRETFRADMRKLWEDHIVWTRQYIVSAATLPEALPDTSVTAERLFANQAHIGSAIGDFYGQAAGDQLTALLTDHIAIAADLITAAKTGDDVATTAARDRWYRNADDIAVFLATANPDSWPADEMKAMMRDHLDHTFAEAVARLTGDYAGDIAAYDQVHEQILHMADMLSSGIINQFPSRFAR